MPDSSIMLELCELLDINVNELLSGRRLDMDSYNKQAEENLLEMKNQKEEADRRLLAMEIVIGGLSLTILLSLTFVASFVQMEEWLRTVLVICGLVPCIIGALFALRIEQIAGYYECQKCHHKYVPTYSGVLWAMHIGRTRHMKCPKCDKRSWNKKVVTKE